MTRGKSNPSGKNKGMKYEEQITSILRKYNLVCDGYVSGGGSDNPDQYFRYNNNCYYLEIKGSKSADFGQIGLQYNHNDQIFTVSKKKENNKDKWGKIDLVKNSGFINLINEKWTDTPRRFTVDKEIFSKEDRNWDYDRFSNNNNEVWAEYNIEFISNYYYLKDVHYIQIKGLGLYYLIDNPAKFDIPKLTGSTKFRARIKRANSRHLSNYNFFIAFKLNSKGIQKSNYSLDNIKDLEQLFC